MTTSALTQADFRRMMTPARPTSAATPAVPSVRATPRRTPGATPSRRGAHKRALDVQDTGALPKPKRRLREEHDAQQAEQRRQAGKPPKGAAEDDDDVFVPSQVYRDRAAERRQTEADEETEGEDPLVQLRKQIDLQRTLDKINSELASAAALPTTKAAVSPTQAYAGEGEDDEMKKEVLAWSNHQVKDLGTRFVPGVLTYRFSTDDWGGYTEVINEKAKVTFCFLGCNWVC